MKYYYAVMCVSMFLKFLFVFLFFSILKYSIHFVILIIMIIINIIDYNQYHNIKKKRIHVTIGTIFQNFQSSNNKTKT